MQNPADNLVGLTLDGGWQVYEKIKKMPGDTGGNFSICYKVRRNREEAFLKALDISRAFRMPNPMKILEILTTTHNYEVELLLACSRRKMDKVVTVLDSGTITPDEGNPNEFPVHYLVFELAEKTVRDHILRLTDILDNASLMRSIHNVSVGLYQLHSAGIAHQDLKPSNVLMFHANGNSKIADLGRAEDIQKQSRLFDLAIAGDPAYAPPELLYKDLNNDWEVRRKATDLYHLGSLICFYYTRDSMTTLLKTFLPVELNWNNIVGHYQKVLPYVQAAFDDACDYIEQCLNNVFTEKKTVSEILSLIRHLCSPDPLQRGHPESRMIPANRYSLERFMTRFDVLANDFESKLL